MIIVNLPIDQVSVGDRLRPIDEDYAALIGASMAELGQRAPIEVTGPNADGKYPLISGGHRLRGAEIAGLETIAAIVRDVDGLAADLLEVDENLTRHELNELDKAVFIQRRSELYEQLYPETKNGAARWKGQNDKLVVLMKSFSEVTAEKLGCSVRSVERAKKRACDIVPSVIKLIGTSWIARRGVHLDAIARLVASEQHAVVRLLLEPTEDGSEMSVADAIRVVRQVPEVREDIPEADYRKLVKLWNKADLTAKKKFSAFLAREASMKGARS